jgi:hypothetical protein
MFFTNSASCHLTKTLCQFAHVCSTRHDVGMRNYLFHFSVSLHACLPLNHGRTKHGGSLIVASELCA